MTAHLVTAIQRLFFGLCYVAGVIIGFWMIFGFLWLAWHYILASLVLANLVLAWCLGGLVMEERRMQKEKP